MKDHREDAYGAMTVRGELLYGTRHGTLSRRDRHKKSLLASGAPAVMSQFKGVGQVQVQVSGATASQTTPVTEAPVHANCDAYVKAEQLMLEQTDTSNVGAGGIGECRRESHQANANFGLTQHKTYLLTQKQGLRAHRNAACWQRFIESLDLVSGLGAYPATCAVSAVDRVGFGLQIGEQGNHLKQVISALAHVLIAAICSPSQLDARQTVTAGAPASYVEPPDRLLAGADMRDLLAKV